MHKSNLFSAIFYVALVSLALSPSILSASTVPPYVPKVAPGQFARYSVLKDSCHSVLPGLCQSFGSAANDTTYAASLVVRVSGPAVTLDLISVYKNGTGAHQGAAVNVATGTSNVTAFSMSFDDYFVLAGNLQAGDQLWNNPTAPRFNTTSSETVLGEMRTVNHLNVTVSGNAYGTVYSQTQVSEFDQSSGFLIDLSLFIRSTGPYATDFEFEIAMVDNNVWRTSYIPDFDLAAKTGIVPVENGSTISPIVLHRLHDFNATVNLSVTASSGDVSCSLSANSLPKGGRDIATVTCFGPPGTYTIRIDGNSGYSMHNANITINVIAPPVQPASILTMPIFYGGIAAAAAVAVLVSILLFRRKPKAPVVAPGDAPISPIPP